MCTRSVPNDPAGLRFFFFPFPEKCLRAIPVYTFLHFSPSLPLSLPRIGIFPLFSLPLFFPGISRFFNIQPPNRRGGHFSKPSAPISFPRFYLHLTGVPPFFSFPVASPPHKAFLSCSVKCLNDPSFKRRSPFQYIVSFQNTSVLLFFSLRSLFFFLSSLLFPALYRRVSDTLSFVSLPILGARNLCFSFFSRVIQTGGWNSLPRVKI